MYELYAKTKENLRLATYAGQNICNPTAAVLAHIFFDRRPIKKKIRKALKLITLTPRYSCRETIRGDSFIWHCDREDQTRLALDISRKISSQKELSITFIPGLKDDTYKSLDWPAMYAALKISRTCKQPLIEKFFIFAALCQAIKHVKAIEKHGILDQITSLVSYNSANIPECFLSNACRQHGIKTYSLQHGLYHRYRNERPIDIINYENITAQKLLVWSEFCRSEIVEFHRERGKAPDFEILVAGYISPLEQRTAAREASHGGRKNILCLLPGKRYIKDCVILLDTLNQLPEDYDVIVRLHPLLADNAEIRNALPRTSILDANQSLTQTLLHRRYDVAVGFNTTSLFEAMLFDIPCALYRAPSLNLEAKGIPSFSTAAELIELDHSVTSTQALATYLLGASVFRYGEIISADLG